MPEPSWRPKPKREYKPRDPAVTSRIMAAVRGRENKAEARLRRALHSRGLRYRLQRRELVGRPDIVFGAARVVVFVDGDYWHGRALVEGGEVTLRQVIRGERFDWWRAKLARNIERDREVTIALEEAGWCVLRFWESDVLKSLDEVATTVADVVAARRPSASE